MTEMRKTLTFAGAAVALAALALATTPHQKAPDQFFDQGQAFFPDFTDPNAARTLEVVDWDEATGAAVPFKVTFRAAVGPFRRTTTIRPTVRTDSPRPRPADQYHKDDFRTDNAADYEACGVVDPLDTANRAPRAWQARHHPRATTTWCWPT
jgi:hypothetical protein